MGAVQNHHAEAAYHQARAAEYEQRARVAAQAGDVLHRNRMLRAADTAANAATVAQMQADVADITASPPPTDQYNAACQAQYAESDRRRDMNVARHERDEAARRRDLTDALQGDDWLEDHGMHGDDRATCHQCQSWADHAHDQVSNTRISREQWEGRTPDGWESTSGGTDDGTGRGPFVMPAPAQPYKPPTKQSTAPTPTSSSGAAMTSADTYSGLRARINGVASRAPERQGALQQALQGVEEDIAELSSISEDSGQAGIQEALGSLMRAREAIEDANWMVGGAQESTEGAAAALQ